MKEPDKMQEEKIKSILRKDADRIIAEALQAVLPDTAVKEALKKVEWNGDGKLVLIAVGKAAWQMAKTAIDELRGKIDTGVVITKYGHSKGHIENLEFVEAGHPVPDENSFLGTQKAIRKVEELGEKDTVLFLVSGGGSALFEKPLISEKELKDITAQLLECGADIVEINTIRKRLSAVKGGRFAQICAPAKVVTIVLSDIIGDPLDMIASGPAYPDQSTCKQAENIVEKYQLKLSEKAMEMLRKETPKSLQNVETYITGSVKQLCNAAEKTARKLGYRPVFLTAALSCEAREAGTFLADIAKSHQEPEEKLAFICGGETVVHVKGNGLGGRNQELVLSAAIGIQNLKNTAIFSIGSDGTDGPTDAAGGFVDTNSVRELVKKGGDPYTSLENNDAYHALDAIGGLIRTGATGTNVNDVTVLLIHK